MHVLRCPKRSFAFQWICFRISYDFPWCPRSGRGGGRLGLGTGIQLIVLRLGVCPGAHPIRCDFDVSPVLVRL